MPRLRLAFRRGTEIKYCSHLDLQRMWIRTLRRAELPIRYSQGFSPHAMVSIVAPLPVAVVGHEELLEIELEQPIAPDEVAARLNAKLPAGAEVRRVWEVADDAPALMPKLRAADFRLTLWSGEYPPDLAERAAALLAAETLPRTRSMGNKPPKRYDLRPLILDLKVELPGGPAEDATILAKLRNDHTGAGRPEELADALGAEPAIKLMERLRLHFADDAAESTPASAEAVALVEDAPASRLEELTGP